MIKYLKILAVSMVIILTAAFSANADWMSLTEGSGQVQVTKITSPSTVSGAAVTGASAFYGIIIKTDGTNDVTINVYDSATAIGSKIVPTNLVVPGTAKVWALAYFPAIKCSIGIYVEISVAGGGSATYQVQYEK